MARKSRKYSEDVPFSITSMMDMMTIILVFMIKNMDAEGQLLTQAENLVLPVSVSKEKPPEEAPLTVVIDRDWIVVDNQKVVKTGEVIADSNSLNPCIDGVHQILHEKRKAEVDQHMRANEPADEAGNIVIQIDKNIPYDIMYRVMYTCGIAGMTSCEGTGKDKGYDMMSGYSKISFAIALKNGGEE